MESKLNSVIVTISNPDLDLIFSRGLHPNSFNLNPDPNLRVRSRGLEILPKTKAEDYIFPVNCSKFQ